MNIGDLQESGAEHIDAEIWHQPPTWKVHLRQHGIARMRQHEVTRQMVRIVEHGWHIDKEEGNRQRDRKRQRRQQPERTRPLPRGRIELAFLRTVSGGRIHAKSSVTRS
jgi:hypothetical protein